MKRRVFICGAGASGLCAGVLLARASVPVTIAEKGKLPGRKLSMTGNGRGNLSNLALHPSCYNAEAYPLLEALLPRFGVRETIAFFRSIRVLLRSEEGYLYPVSGQAATLTRALTDSFLEAGGRILYETQVKEVKAAGPARYLVRTDRGTHEAETVVLATGGISGPRTVGATGDGYFIAEGLGLRTSPRHAALVRLHIEELPLPAEKGVRADAEIRFFADDALFARERGEVQLTGRTLSGIPVLQASGQAARLLAEKKKLLACLNLFPDTEEEEFEALVREWIAGASGTLRSFFNGFCNARIGELLCFGEGLSPETEVSAVRREVLHRMLYACRSLRLAVTGTGGALQAQATSGGVALDALSMSLEAHAAPGIYCIGELADVDGRCGGYNLQWAWSSAMAAAEDILLRMKDA